MMAKLLIVDDDHDTCEYLKEFFEQRKCLVVIKNSAPSALLFIKAERPDIVLLDVRLGEGQQDGLSFLQNIKKFDATIKVVIMTVASDDQAREKAFAFGADDFIQKPFHAAYLEGVVSQKVAALAQEKKKSLLLPKILIVDDEMETRQTLRDYLSRRVECEILEASSGYEAIEKLKKETIDLLLTDMKMPGIRGTEVMEQARAISEDMPIIVLTKWDSAQMSQQMKDFGAEYIPKPFSLKIVKSKVEEKLKSIGKFFIKNG